VLDGIDWHGSLGNSQSRNPAAELGVARTGGRANWGSRPNRGRANWRSRPNWDPPSNRTVRAGVRANRSQARSRPISGRTRDGAADRKGGL